MVLKQTVYETASSIPQMELSTCLLIAFQLMRKDFSTIMKLTEKMISSQPIYNGHIIKVKKDTVLLENGSTAVREVVEHNGAVCVVPIETDGSVYMVRQFRYPFSRIMLEVPAGKIDEGEEPLVAAKRELEEEIGMIAEEWIDMGEYIPSCAFLTERIHMYIARGFAPSKQNLDEDEFLHVEQIPFPQLLSQITENKICDGKTIASLLKAHLILKK